MDNITLRKKIGIGLCGTFLSGLVQASALANDLRGEACYNPSKTLEVIEAIPRQFRRLDSGTYLIEDTSFDFKKYSGDDSRAGKLTAIINDDDNDFERKNIFIYDRRSEDEKEWYVVSNTHSTNPGCISRGNFGFSYLDPTTQWLRSHFDEGQGKFNEVIGELYGKISKPSK